METRITATELARSLSDVLSRVRYMEESFVIVRNGEPVAVLTPADSSGPPEGMTLRELAASMRGIPMPGDGFADDLEAIRASGSPIGEPRCPS